MKNKTLFGITIILIPILTIGYWFYSYYWSSISPPDCCKMGYDMDLKIENIKQGNQIYNYYLLCEYNSTFTQQTHKNIKNVSKESWRDYLNSRNLEAIEGTKLSVGYCEN